MKKRIILISILLNVSCIAFAQQPSIEQKVYGIQAGFFGIWGHCEYKLHDKIAIRGELGFDNGVGQTYNGNAGYYLVPSIALEPKWYYNLEKRQAKSKRIDGNSGNYFSLFLRYHPDWFVISNVNTGNVIPDISIIPTWGIRRKMGNHISFETAIGFGYRYTFTKRYGYSTNTLERDMNFTLRFGYIF